MYIPTLFKEDNPQVLQDLMVRHPLATLVTLGSEGLETSLVPLLYDPAPQAGAPHGVLRGHLARANPQWRDCRPGTEALALFQGPQAYVSPNWYPSKAEHGKAVPTWNYAVVEARGLLAVMEDPAWLRRLLADLTAVHEAGQPRPWTLEEAPDDYLAAQMKAVVGIEIAVTRLAGKWKMSQNRPAAGRRGVESALAAGDGHARAVSERLPGPAVKPWQSACCRSRS